MTVPLAALCLGTTWSGALRAASGLHLEAVPLLGQAEANSGWRSVLVRLENSSTQTLRGQVELASRPSWARSSWGKTGAEFTTRVPFSLAPKARVSFEAPTRAFGEGAPAVRVTAMSESGEAWADVVMSNVPSADAVLLDLQNPSRVAAALRHSTFISDRTPSFGSRGRIGALGVATPQVDAATSDLILPELPAGYAGTTLVLGTGRDLERLSTAEQSALANWVLGGGALALWLDRPEDFRHLLVETLAGGSVARVPVTSHLAEPAQFFVADEAEQNPNTPPKSTWLRPGAALSGKLSGYAGGNLKDSPWGQSASYGLGELHLLAFDPHQPAVLEDTWVTHKLVDLVRHGFDREPTSAVHHSSVTPNEVNVDSIRRELDPNQATRWTIIVSALLLLAYAGVAGPLNFYWAARRQRPLSALLYLPALSVGTLLLIMGIGLFGKGTRGRARRLSVIDVAAGMSRGSAVRFRAFYAPSAHDLRVRGSQRDSVLDLALASDELTRILVFDREGGRLEGLRTRPWQTVLVREESQAELGSGVSVLPIAGASGDLTIKNRTGRDLLGVVLRQPGGKALYFARIKDGASVRASAGRGLPALLSPSGYPARPTSLEAAQFASVLDADAPGLGKAWLAVEPALGIETIWWPDDVPVLLAALEGGEGRTKDSGLDVDYDRVLVRVVGTGGAQ